MIIHWPKGQCSCERSIEGGVEQAACLGHRRMALRRARASSDVALLPQSAVFCAGVPKGHAAGECVRVGEGAPRVPPLARA